MTEDQLPEKPAERDFSFLERKLEENKGLQDRALSAIDKSNKAYKKIQDEMGKYLRKEKGFLDYFKGVVVPQNGTRWESAKGFLNKLTHTAYVHKVFGFQEAPISEQLVQVLNLAGDWLEQLKTYLTDPEVGINNIISELTEDAHDLRNDLLAKMDTKEELDEKIHQYTLDLKEKEIAYQSQYGHINLKEGEIPAKDHLKAKSELEVLKDEKQATEFQREKLESEMAQIYDSVEGSEMLLKGLVTAKVVLDGGYNTIDRYVRKEEKRVKALALMTKGKEVLTKSAESARQLQDFSNQVMQQVTDDIRVLSEIKTHLLPVRFYTAETKKIAEGNINAAIENEKQYDAAHAAEILDDLKNKLGYDSKRLIEDKRKKA